MTEQVPVMAALVLLALAGLGWLDSWTERLSAKFAEAFENLGVQHGAPRKMPRWLKFGLPALFIVFVVWSCHPSKAVAHDSADKQGHAERAEANLDNAIFRAVPANLDAADKGECDRQGAQESIEQADANSLKAGGKQERTGCRAGDGEKRQADNEIFHAAVSPLNRAESIA